MNLKTKSEKGESFIYNQEQNTLLLSFVHKDDHKLFVHKYDHKLRKRNNLKHENQIRKKREST